MVAFFKTCLPRRKAGFPPFANYRFSLFPRIHWTVRKLPAFFGHTQSPILIHRSDLELLPLAQYVELRLGYFCLGFFSFFHLACTALRASSERSLGESVAALPRPPFRASSMRSSRLMLANRALPPSFPRAAAAAFFFAGMSSRIIPPKRL